MAPLILIVKDDSGDHINLATSTESACKVPYLQTMLNTQVGNASAMTHEIALPTGCSVNAFASLLKRVDADGTDLRLSWVANAAASVALICTADFLLLKDLMPELARHCRQVTKSPSDVKLLLTLRITHSDVMSLVRDLRQGQLGGTITTQQVQYILKDMSLDYESVSFCIQAMALVQWLRHPDRTTDDLQRFVSAFEAQTLWDLGVAPFTLKKGALDFVSSMTCVAKERSSFFAPLIECIFKPFPICTAEDLKSLVGKVFSDATVGKPLMLEELKQLMRHVTQQVFEAGFSAHLASLFDNCCLEGKDTLVSELSSLPATKLNRLVTVEFLQLLGAAPRATIVAQILTSARTCDSKVLAFIKEAIVNGNV